MKPDDLQFRLLEPFDIGGGQLSRVTPERAFTLGVEWAMFRRQLLQGRPFTAWCLPENRTRLVRLAESHRRFVEDRPKACVDWCEIWVGDSIA